MSKTAIDPLAQDTRGGSEAGALTDGFHLVIAVFDEKAGTESGRIGNLNPQSVVSTK